MTEGKCAICSQALDKEEADILTMGAYGLPRYICAECASDLSTATKSHDFKEIEEAMDRLGEKLTGYGIDDERTVEAVYEIFEEAKSRAVEIKEGTYDFSLDEEEDPEILNEIPEELLESEEDRLLDEKEAEISKKWDAIINWLILAMGAFASIYIVYYFFFK